jgi:putative flippase GtrA
MRDNFVNLQGLYLRGQGKYLRKRYLFVGLLNTIFSVTLFYILLHVFQNLQYQLTLLICFFIANLESHFTQRLLVWESVNPYFSELGRFFVGAIGMFLINLLLLTFFVDFLDYNTFASQVFLVLILPILNFFFQKHAVFRASQS